MTSHLLRLWVIGSYEMRRCDWLQHCNFLAGIEILPIALQTACKPCGFAVGRPAIVAGPVLRVAIGESCSVCRALYRAFCRSNIGPLCVMRIPCVSHRQNFRVRMGYVYASDTLQHTGIGWHALRHSGREKRRSQFAGGDCDRQTQAMVTR